MPHSAANLLRSAIGHNAQFATSHPLFKPQTYVAYGQIFRRGLHTKLRLKRAARCVGDLIPHGKVFSYISIGSMLCTRVRCLGDLRIDRM